MLAKGLTVHDAAVRWVGEFNAIPRGMIEKLMRAEPDDWQERTAPAVGCRVYVCRTVPHEGELMWHKNGTDNYKIRLDDGTCVIVGEDDFEVEWADFLPMWGTMWSFGERLDDDWLENDGGIQAMSDCGFRIFEHEEWGYFFGIDGAGYDFYEAHWIPLYKARGLQWHDPATERKAS